MWGLGVVSNRVKPARLVWSPAAVSINMPRGLLRSTLEPESPACGGVGSARALAPGLEAGIYS